MCSIGSLCVVLTADSSVCSTAQMMIHDNMYSVACTVIDDSVYLVA